MTQAVQDTGKRRGRITHRGEARIAVPHSRSACVQVAAQCVMSVESTLHALQVSPRLAVGHSQAVDHGVAGTAYGQAGGRP